MSEQIRVLYLDDNPADQDLVKNLLEREVEGFQVKGIASRQALEEALARGDFDVVVSDGNILGYEGLQVLDVVRAQAPAVPLILLTGSGSEEMAVEALKKGAADYVLKSPRHLRRLPLAIRNALDEVHLAREREALLEQLRLQSAALQAAGEAVVITDRQGRVQWVNPAFTALSGYTLEEAYGHSLRELQRLGYHDPSFYEILDRIFAEGQSWRGETVNRRKDGSLYIEEQSITPIRDERGEITHFVSVKQDVSERKRGEESLRRRLRELDLISAVSYALRTANTPQEIWPPLLDQVLEKMEVEGAAVEILNSDTGELITELGKGIWEPLTGEIIPPGQGISAELLITHRPYLNNEARHDPRLFRPETFGDCRAAIGVPMMVKGQIRGLLWVGSRRSLDEEDLRLLTTVGDIAANTLHRLELYDEALRHLKYMQALHTVDRAISSSFDLNFAAGVVLEQCFSLLQADAAGLLLFDPLIYELGCVLARGFRSERYQQFRLSTTRSPAGRAILEGRPLFFPRVDGMVPPCPRQRLLEEEGIVAYWVAPLVAKGQAKGVLELFYRKPTSPKAEDLQFLEGLAQQAAIAVDNAQLLNRLQQTNLDLMLAYDATIEGWSKALELRDRETEGHTQRVVDLTLEIARRMGMSEEQLVHVRRGALLHDIGKLGIPDSILFKPGPLSEGEWAVMHQHPVMARDMLAPIPYLQPAMEIPYCHHECWDGSGYPRGLKGEQIPLSARIFAVVDVWDALTSERPYRPAFSKVEALEYIRGEAGKHFDPQVVKVFLEVVQGNAG